MNKEVEALQRLGSRERNLAANAEAKERARCQEIRDVLLEQQQDSTLDVHPWLGSYRVLITRGQPPSRFAAVELGPLLLEELDENPHRTAREIWRELLRVLPRP